jgi:hypothetical protein
MIVSSLDHAMPRDIKSEKEIRVGDFYEDCAYHPCLCVVAGSEGDEDGLEGISLVDGSLRSCSARHCGVRLLTIEEAIHWKLHGPKDQTIAPQKRWWKG